MARSSDLEPAMTFHPTGEALSQNDSSNQILLERVQLFEKALREQDPQARNDNASSLRRAKAAGFRASSQTS